MSPDFSQRYDCLISTSFSSKLRGNYPCILFPCHFSFVFSAMLSFTFLVSLCTSVLRHLAVFNTAELVCWCLKTCMTYTIAEGTVNKLLMLDRRTAFEQEHMLLLEICLKPVWHIPLLSVQWINSWWRTEEMSETCRVSCQIKFVKLVHLVGFIMKKHFSHCKPICWPTVIQPILRELVWIFIGTKWPGIGFSFVVLCRRLWSSVSLITYMYACCEMVVCRKICFSEWFSSKRSVLGYNLCAFLFPIL